jgi:hypothetical protein
MIIHRDRDSTSLASNYIINWNYPIIIREHLFDRIYASEILVILNSLSLVFYFSHMIVPRQRLCFLHLFVCLRNIFKDKIKRRVVINTKLTVIHSDVITSS